MKKLEDRYYGFEEVLAVLRNASNEVTCDMVSNLHVQRKWKLNIYNVFFLCIFV